MGRCPSVVRAESASGAVEKDVSLPGIGVSQGRETDHRSTQPTARTGRTLDRASSRVAAGGRTARLREELIGLELLVARDAGTKRSRARLRRGRR